MMTRRTSRTANPWLIAGGVALLALVLAPFALAGGAGRLVGSLWVSVLAAVAGLIGGLFGG